jgi:hypothetical protein
VRLQRKISCAKLATYHTKQMVCCYAVVQLWNASCQSDRILARAEQRLLCKCVSRALELRISFVSEALRLFLYVHIYNILYIHIYIQLLIYIHVCGFAI